MKPNLTLTSLTSAVLLMAAGAACGASLTWTGASPSKSLLWSDPDNWDLASSPTGADVVNLYDSGSTNVLGAINNIVGTDTTITNLTYKARVSYIAMVTNYHSTLLDPGVTLTIDRGTFGSSLIYVGEITDPQSNDLHYYYKISGPGAGILAGNVAEPQPSQGLQVTATQRSYTNHYSTLDMSELDSFTLAGGYFWVGINGGEGTAVTDRPAGRVNLAKTNLIVMVGNYYDGLNLGSFRVGESRANTPYKPSFLELGQENSIYTPWLKIGGARQGNEPAQGGHMYFRSGLESPTLKLRGSDGVSRLGTMRIADNSWSSGGSIGTRGGVDLSGGKVDAYINELFVGRGPGGNSATAPPASAFAAGTLTWTDGTFDVLTMLVGYQYGNNPTTNSGVVNVLTPKARLIADRLVLGRDAGANSGGGVGLLNIDGGTVEITTYLSESPGAGGNAASTIILTNGGVLNLQPVGDTEPAVATIDTLEFSSGAVTNGTLALNQLNVWAPASEFVAYPGTVLNAGTSGGVGTMAVNGNLKLSGGGIAADVESTSSLDQINVTGTLSLTGLNSVLLNPLNPISPGTYTLMSYGTLSGTSANLQASGAIADSRYTTSFDASSSALSVTIAGSPSTLTWSGGKNANAWDIKTTANWNSGADQFYAFDTVEFGDGGSASPAINLIGSLVPAAVSFTASSKDYTLAGSGKISGLSGLALNGSSTVTLLTTNDYKGNTDINNGTLILGDGLTANGALGSGTVNNFGTLIFKPASAQTVAAVIAGSGSIIKRSPGITRLSGANTFTGSLAVEAGTLQGGNTSALGDATAGTVTISSGATLDLGGFTLNKPIMVSGAGVDGQGAIINSGSANFLRDVQLAAATTFGGSNGWTVQSSAANAADPGLTAWGYKITKVAPNQVKVNGLRSMPWDLDLGEVEVKEGVFTLAGNITLGTQTSKPITVRSNATLELGAYPLNVLTKSYVFDDGSCLFLQGTNSILDGSITLGGTVIFDVISGRTLTLNCPVTGGSLIKGAGSFPAKAASTGVGTLVLNGANTFSKFRVETGTVILSTDATISAPEIVLAGGTLSASNRTDNTLTLNGGQSLKGNGTVVGIVMSPAGTTVAPQQTNGLLAITGNLTLRGNTILDLNRTGAATNNSRINVTGTLDCGGSLTLTSSGEPLRAGDTFKLFAAGTTLNPFQTSAITWPALNSGLFWTNRLALDGTVAVASVEPVAPPVLTATFSTTQLSLQWPAEYVSYVLQSQTNAANVGLSGAWQTVTGTTGNQITIPIDPANPTVFYRLIKQ